jgi:hypothetical protein
MSAMAEMTTAGNATAALAKGKVTSVKDGIIHFAPGGTNYELHLVAPNFAGKAGALAEGEVRVKARKVWTVTSGGNFISPIFGPPRTIQGRVRALTEREMVLHAGTNIVVELPASEDGYDLASGPLAVGVMANVVALPHAGFTAATR